MYICGFKTFVFILTLYKKATYYEFGCTRK